jgi:hypothetical protein
MSEFAFGAKIEANYQSSGKWYPGSVMGIRPGGTFDVLYEDGDGESEVPAERIRSKGAAPESADTVAGADATAAAAAAAPAGTSEKAPASSAPAASSGAAVGPWAAGTTVEVRHRGKTWRTAKVTEVDAELQCANVEFTDATVEKGVPFGLMRAPSPAGASVASTAERPSKKSSRSKGDKKSRRKKINAVYELCQNFSDAELDAAMSMLQAIEALRVAQGGGVVEAQ